MSKQSFNPANPYFSFSAPSSSSSPSDSDPQPLLYNFHPSQHRPPPSMPPMPSQGVDEGKHILNLLRKSNTAPPSEAQTKVTAIEQMLREYENKMEAGSAQGSLPSPRGGTPTLPEFQGTVFSSRSTEYTLPSLVDLSQSNELSLSQIVRYERNAAIPGSEYSGSLVAHDNTYLVYAIKKGLIRVLKRSDNASKSLFKHGTDEIVHISVFQSFRKFANEFENGISKTSLESLQQNSVLLSIDCCNLLKVWEIVSDDSNSDSFSCEELSRCSSPVSYAVFHSQNPSWVVTQFESSVQLWDIDTGKSSTVMDISKEGEEQAIVNHICCSPCGGFIAAACSDGFVRVHSLGGQFVAKFMAADTGIDNSSQCEYIEYSVSGSLLISASRNCSLVNAFSATTYDQISALNLCPSPESARDFKFFKPSVVGSEFVLSFTSDQYSYSGLLFVTLSEEEGNQGLLGCSHTTTSNKLMGLSFDLVDRTTAGTDMGLEGYCVQKRSISSLRVDSSFLPPPPLELSNELVLGPIPFDSYETLYSNKNTNKNNTKKNKNKTENTTTCTIKESKPKPSLVVKTKTRPKSKSSTTSTTPSSSSLPTIKILSRKDSSSSPPIPEAVVPSPTPTPPTPPPTTSTNTNTVAKKQSIENALVSRLNRLFEQHHSKLLKLVEQGSEEREQLERERIERIMYTLSSQLEESLPSLLSPSSLSEAILPPLEERVSQLLDVSVLSKAVHKPLKDTFQHSFKTILLPALERSFKVMFKQVDTHLQTYLQERENTLLEKLEENTRIMNEMKREMKKLTSCVSKSISRRDSMDFSEQKQTQKQPQKSAEQLINECISSQDYEKAYTIALNTGNLDMVVSLCSSLSSDMWSVVPKLSGAVVLSLIHQLSHDLSSQVDVKLNWLSSSLLRLQKAEMDSEEHVGPVLDQVEEHVRKCREVFSPAQDHSASLIMHIINNLQNMS